MAWLMPFDFSSSITFKAVYLTLFQITGSAPNTYWGSTSRWLVQRKVFCFSLRPRNSSVPSCHPIQNAGLKWKTWIFIPSCLFWYRCCGYTAFLLHHTTIKNGLTAKSSEYINAVQCIVDPELWVVHLLFSNKWKIKEPMNDWISPYTCKY